MISWFGVDPYQSGERNVVVSKTRPEWGINSQDRFYEGVGHVLGASNPSNLGNLASSV